MVGPMVSFQDPTRHQGKRSLLYKCQSFMMVNSYKLPFAASEGNLQVLISSVFLFCHVFTLFLSFFTSRTNWLFD